MAEVTDYRIRVWREPDGSWSAQGVDVPAAVTTGNSLSEVERYAKEALAVALDLPRSKERDIRPVLEISVDDGGPLDQVTEDAVKARAAAAEAAKSVRTAVLALRAKGMSTRDIARLTGVTGGRVSQIVSGRASSAA